ncbi:hypothetical protein KA013_04745 [Patescibacteria group bacterium]|nr:hypothetical protein [Patescibacteria group bacterium]
MDFVEIDAASHTGVDNIREEIIDKALYPPSNLKKKVYVIDEVHMLSKGAFNALLKIMEEPPHYLLFILATTEINKVPDTIISRCQVFNFTRVTIDDIVTRLALIAKKENIEYEDEGLRLIAKLSSGALRDAIKYLEQVSMLGKVTAASVTMFLGAVSESVLNEFIGLVRAGKPDDIFSYLDGLADGGVDLTSFAKDILLWLDERFMDDIPFSVGLANAFKEIVIGVKNYPYPLIVYKTVLRKYLTKDGATPDMTTTSKPAKAIKKETKAEESSQESESAPAAKKETAKSTPGSKEEAKEVPAELGYDDIMQELIARTD